MKSKMNYNYAFVFYDVNEKRVNRNVFGEEVLGIQEVINGETLIL